MMKRRFEGNGWYDPEPQGINLESVFWKIVIAEIIAIILKLVYTVYIAERLLKEHPEQSAVEFFHLLQSPMYYLIRWLFPDVVNEEEIEKLRKKNLADIGVPAFVDDIFGKYFLIILGLIPVAILMFEYSRIKRREKRKFVRREKE